MSMNLVFKVKDTGETFVDFPFQTPSELTFAVLDCTTDEGRLKLIKEYLDKYDCGDEFKERVLRKTKEMLASPSLELGME